MSNTRWRWVAVIGAAVALAVHTVMRARGLFGPPQGRPLILASFLLFWPTPWLFLRADERRAIGFGRPRAWTWWPIAVLSGVAAALICFGLSWLLFAATADNPFISIRQSFLSGGVPPVGRLGLFLIFTGPGMIFSPFGEEVFCRGVLYGRVRAASSSALAGTLASASIFASIHLLHHGLTLHDGEVGFRLLSGVLWFVMMFCTSLLFSALRTAGSTIWLAVISHSAFNLAMNAAIFSVFTG